MANPNPSPATRWKAGQSGNPQGRQAQPLTRAVLDKCTPERAEKVAEHLWAAAERGDPWAIAQLWDRLEGKPVARTEQGEPGSFDLSGIDSATIRRALKRVK